VFILHIALLALSIWAVALAIGSTDLTEISATLNRGRAARWVGTFLAVVGLVLGSLWVVLSVRFAITGELMADIPADGVHLVFAIDLALLVPALIVTGVLLWRRTTAGTVFGAAMAILGALYQVNLLLAGVFQANADVPGAKSFPPEGIVVAIGFVTLVAILFRSSRTAVRMASPHGRRER
jgi:hypothetical protein